MAPTPALVTLFGEPVLPRVPPPEYRLEPPALGSMEDAQGHQLKDLLTRAGVGVASVPAQGSDQWKADRMGVLTASNAASCLGRSFAYQTRAQMLHHYAGVCPLPEPSEFVQNMMNKGHEYEDQAIMKARMDLGITEKSKVYQFGLMKHKDYPQLGASVDGVVQNTDTGELEMWEIKTRVRGALLDTPDPPDRYLDQIQMCLEVTGIEWGRLVQYKRDELWSTDRVVMHRIARDPMWAQENIPKLLKFWEEVQRLK